MTSLLPQSPVAEFPQDPIQQKPRSTRWLRYVMPALLVLFTSLLFWLTYTLQHSCTPLVGPLPQACYIAGVTIQPDQLKPLERGKTKQLIAKVELKNRPRNDKTKFTKEVDWKSTHPEFAFVDLKGRVTARMPGETEIIATSRENLNKWAMVKVKVEADPKITKIEFLPNELSGYDGEQFNRDKDFVIDVQGERNFDKTLKYESGNSQIADVDPSTDSKKLKIELKSPGEAYVTATSTVDPKQKGSMKITVLPPQIEGIQIEPSSFTLQPSKTKKLKVTFEGKGKFDRSVIWSSDNENIAEVDSDGTVLAKEEGKTIIWVVSKVDPNNPNNPNITSGVELNVKKIGPIIVPAVVAGGVCLVATSSMLVPPPLSVPMCGSFAGGFYWLFNH